MIPSGRCQSPDQVEVPPAYAVMYEACLSGQRTQLPDVGANPMIDAVHELSLVGVCDNRIGNRLYTGDRPDDVSGIVFVAPVGIATSHTCQYHLKA